MVVEETPSIDPRGSFSRIFCQREFAQTGLVTDFPAAQYLAPHLKGTLRGMHFQRAPYEEVGSLVGCLKGRILDVIIDLRPDLPTFRRWEAFELSPDCGRQIYVPKGFAHGFQTLTDDVEVRYMISQFYAPEAASGVRYDDPAFTIDWPLPVDVISDRDRDWPDFA